MADSSAPLMPTIAVPERPAVRRRRLSGRPRDRSRMGGIASPDPVLGKHGPAPPAPPSHQRPSLRSIVSRQLARSSCVQGWVWDVPLLESALLAAEGKWTVAGRSGLSQNRNHKKNPKTALSTISRGNPRMILSLGGFFRTLADPPRVESCTAPDTNGEGPSFDEPSPFVWRARRDSNSRPPGSQLTFCFVLLYYHSQFQGARCTTCTTAHNRTGQVPRNPRSRRRPYQHRSAIKTKWGLVRDPYPPRPSPRAATMPGDTGTSHKPGDLATGFGQERALAAPMRKFRFMLEAAVHARWEPARRIRRRPFLHSQFGLSGLVTVLSPLFFGSDFIWKADGIPAC